MGRDRPTLRCFAAPQLADGRVRGTPLLVSLETAEWLFREQQYAVVGPDPHDEIDLATWEREGWPLHRTT